LFLGANAQKKVLYLGYNKASMITTNGRDSLLLWLKSIPSVFTVDTAIDVTNYKGTYAAAVAAKSTNGASDYDLVVISDCLDGKKCSTLTASVITKPLLLNKLFAMTSARLNMGTPANMTSGPLYLRVPAGEDTSKIFTGITIPESRAITIFNTYTDDFGATGLTGSTAGIQVITDGTYTLNPTTGMEILGRDTVSTTYGISLFRLAANTQMYYGTTAGQAYTVPIIAVGFNYGAQYLKGNMTTNGLRILQNSVYILAGLDPSNVNVITAAPQIKNPKLSILRNGNQFQIQFGKVQKTDVSVYSATGVLVSKKLVNADNTTIDLTGKAKGVYIIKAAGLTQKVVVE
jgi:hypothetical protein